MAEVTRPATPSIVALVAALNRVVPAPIVLEATPRGVKIGRTDDEGFRSVEAWDGVSLEEFARALLDALQDEVAEAVAHTGWPPTNPRRPDEPQRGVELPTPRAEVAGGVLRCWYGDRDRPALSVEPISLTAE